MLIYNAEMPSERLNVADTVKVQWNAYLGAGKLLLSDMGRVLMSILADDAGTHDAFCGTSNAATNQAKYGEGRNSGAYPNGRDRLLLGSAKHGLQRRDVHPCVNLFKGARIEADGAITPLVGPYEAGRTMILRAEMDVIVVIANCPHVLDPRGDWTRDAAARLGLARRRHVRGRPHSQCHAGGAARLPECRRLFPSLGRTTGPK